MNESLRSLAEAATPGPWTNWKSRGMHQIDAATKTVVHWSGFDQLQTPNEKAAIGNNAAFIAAANPAAIIALLDELQTLREERTAWRVTAENAEAELAALKASLGEPVAWLTRPNAFAHPNMEPDLTFDAPNLRVDWDVHPLYALNNKDQS